MKIITLNANGIRSAAKKGFFEWMQEQDADVVCIQETKAQIHQLEDACFFPTGYHCYYCDAQKKGYSGVAIYTRIRPKQVNYGLGWDAFDDEGRWLQVDFDDLSVISLYMPSGSAKEERQQFKFEVMDWMMPKLKEMRDADRNYVICGDWNIAHKEIDLKNWKSNQKNSGFLPEERAWLTELFDEVGMLDAFRQVDQSEHQYTWWSNRGRAWDNNVGWRIDYHITSPELKSQVESASIFRDDRFSDHAPLTVTYNDI